MPSCFSYVCDKSILFLECYVVVSLKMKGGLFDLFVNVLG